MGYTQKSSYPGITPEIAASGVEEALKVLGGRWKLIILFYLFRDGTLRLSELERVIPGITQKMLIQQLRSLERDGVVSRLVHPVVPPKVEYSLTPRGQDLCPALDELLYWAQLRTKFSYTQMYATCDLLQVVGACERQSCGRGESPVNGRHG